MLPNPHKSPARTLKVLAALVAQSRAAGHLYKPPASYYVSKSYSVSRLPEEGKLLQRIWTLPNALSLFRIAMTPALGLLVITERPLAAVLLLAVCGVSDFFDGWIARRFRQQSALGSVLDPLGDKLLVGTLGISLFCTGQLPSWLLLLILGRDIYLIGISAVIRWNSLKGEVTFKKFFDPSIAMTVVQPTWISKVNTALQFLLLGLTLGDPILDVHLVHQFLRPLQWVVAGTTVTSALDYFVNYKRSIKYIRK